MLIYSCDGVAAFVAEEIAMQDHGGDTHFTVTIVDGEVAACAEVKRFPRCLSLNYIAVRPDFRSRGLAKHLLREAIVFAGMDGQQEMSLDVLTHNTMARTWYERLGFRTEGNAAWWTISLEPGTPSPVLLTGYPQSQACQRTYGFSMFSIIAAGCEYKVGRLGKQWFRLMESEAMHAPGVLEVLSQVDPSRRILLASSNTTSPPTASARLAAQWCRMAVDLDTLRTRLAMA